MRFSTILSTLMLTTALTACGGGGGGGHGNIPNTTLPDVVNPDIQLNTNNNEAVTTMKTRVITDTDGFTALVKNTLGNDIYSGVETNSMLRLFSSKSNSNICKTERDCNQQIFDNMIKILVDNDLENASWQEIKQALILAGFKDDLPGHTDDIKAWLKEHKDEIKEKVDDIFNNYANLTIYNAKLNLVTLHEDKQNSYVRLTIDENNKIDGIEISKNKNMSNELQYVANRDGSNNKFVSENSIYRYGINTQYYSGTFIDSITELTPEEIQIKLNKRVEELAATGAYDTEAYSRNEVVARIKKAIAVALGLSENDGSIKVFDYEGDIRSIDNEPDPSKPEYFEYCHMEYTKTEEISYKSYITTEGNQLNLAYSDFGMIKKDATYSDGSGKNISVFEGAGTEISVFAGGYESKKIDPQNIASNMNFSGKAIGAVNVIYGENEGSDVYNNLTPLELNGDANLQFNADEGIQTVTATFDNWYDVTVTSAVGGTDNKLKLNNWKENSGTSNDYKFRDQNQYDVVEFTTAKQLADDFNTATEAEDNYHSGPAFGAFNVGYYGDDNNPKETTGYIYYEEARGYNSTGLSKEDYLEQNPNIESDDEYYDSFKNISVNIGFGGVRK